MRFFDFFSKKNDSGYSEFEFVGERQSNLRAFDEEYAEVIDVDMDGTNTVESYNSYAHSGVQLQGEQQSIQIVYQGLLAQQGAHNIYAVVGYGNNLRWEDIEYYPLRKINTDIYELILPIKREGNINIAFKDCANNWDNNMGMNYIFKNDFIRDSH